MNLTDQVVSLSLAKKLKELGVKQDEALYCWSNGGIKDREWELIFGVCTTDDYAAFTVAELGEILPGTLGIKHEVYRIMIEWMQGLWRVSYQSTGEGQFLEEMFAVKEAEARGLMLAYLIENKLISV